MVDTTPEARRATDLAAWPGTWVRDEEAVGACEEERARGTTDRSALSGRDRPLRPELPSGRLCNLGNAAAIWVHGEQIAEPGGWTVREDDLRPVRRPAGIEAGALPRRIEVSWVNPLPSALMVAMFAVPCPFTCGNISNTIFVPSGDQFGICACSAGSVSWTRWPPWMFTVTIRFPQSLGCLQVTTFRWKAISVPSGET